MCVLIQNHKNIAQQQADLNRRLHSKLHKYFICSVTFGGNCTGVTGIVNIFS